MTILGIDPGTATTGFGIIKTVDKTNFEVVDFGIITTSKKDTDSERLFQISNDVNALIKKYKPEVMGIEKLFFSTNQKTGIAVAESRGIILLSAQQKRIPIMEFTPLQVKNRICGYGKADKKQVQFIVQQTFKLKKLPKPDDAADALAIALCAGLSYKNILS
jgi:crossover junction endodeoxyribonuclease RuvC